MKLSDLIIQYRTDHGYSQRQFAVRCELSNGYISMLEKGINPATQKPVTPTMPQLKKLADGMGMSVMELLEQVEDMPIVISPEDNATSPTLSLAASDKSLDLSKAEEELIRKFRRLDQRGQAAVLNTLEHEYSSLPGENAPPAARNA